MTEPAGTTVPLAVLAEQGPPQDGRRTLTQLINRYLQGRRRRGEISARTTKQLAYTLAGFDRSFGNRPLEYLKRRALERWLEQIGHMSPMSRRGQISAVRGLCRWLVDEGLIAEDPTLKLAKVRVPRVVPRALPQQDVGQLLERVPDQRARVIIALMVGCGLRCIEVSRLTMGDYDPAGRTITVVGKADHERLLPLPKFVHDELTRYLNLVGIRQGGPLICHAFNQNKPLGPTTLSAYVSRWMTAAGIKHGRGNGRSAHALRHTAASDVLDGGADLRTVQEMLGHKQLSSTAIYLRRAHLGQLREAMEGRDYRTDVPKMDTK